MKIKVPNIRIGNINHKIAVTKYIILSDIQNK